MVTTVFLPSAGKPLNFHGVAQLGIDEVGRGAWAGPLVVAGCLTPPEGQGQLKYLIFWHLWQIRWAFKNYLWGRMNLQKLASAPEHPIKRAIHNWWQSPGLLRPRERLESSPLDLPVTAVWAWLWQWCQREKALSHKTPRSQRQNGEVRDSKKLTPPQRRRRLPGIFRQWDVILIWVSPQTIDRWGISWVNRASLRLAAHLVPQTPDLTIITDGPEQWPDWPNQTGIVKADATWNCVADASIVAKVFRDDFMEALAQLYPQYGFDKHKGYGTQQHRQAVEKWGLTPWHRHSWAIPTTQGTNLNLFEPAFENF